MTSVKQFIKFNIYEEAQKAKAPIYHDYPEVKNEISN